MQGAACPPFCKGLVQLRNSKEAMTKLSVNINKIATLRNARGGDNPNVILAAQRAQAWGAQGITVHPRPDERHITYNDTQQLKREITTEYNIEGNPIPRFMNLVLAVRPQQVTLVPDAENAITSNAGWDTVTNAEDLHAVVVALKEKDIRVSIFVDPDERMVEGAAKVGADRVELYTEPYASGYAEDREAAIAPYLAAARKAKELGLMVNAGHDLDLTNLSYLIERIPWIAEVSIGHALICDALYMGLEKAIAAYLDAIRAGESAAAR